MKSALLVLIALFFFTNTSFGQKGKEKYQINLEKVEYVAHQKTEELDKIVRLKKGEQKEAIKKLYTSHEINVQKLRQSQKNKKEYTSDNANKEQKGHKTGLEKQIMKQEILLDGQIQKELTTKQKTKLKNHKNTLVQA